MGEAAPERNASVVHASCVAWGARAVLIRGAAGRGKSGLALRLMALGAGLVADDRTRLWREGARLMADAPATIRGRIEARGAGILTVPAVGPVPLVLVVDLDAEAESRLPPLKQTEVEGIRLPLLENAPYKHFTATILLYLKGASLT